MSTDQHLSTQQRRVLSGAKKEWILHFGSCFGMVFSPEIGEIMEPSIPHPQKKEEEIFVPVRFCYVFPACSESFSPKPTSEW